MSHLSNRVSVLIHETGGGDVPVSDTVRGIIGRVYSPVEDEDQEPQEIAYTHWEMITTYADQIPAVQSNTRIVEAGEETPLGPASAKYGIATILVDRLNLPDDPVAESATLDGLEAHIEGLANAEGANWKNRYFSTARKAKLYLPVPQEEI